MQDETITTDPNKNYLTDPPFFVTDGKQVEILRSADFWNNPSEGGNK